MPWQTGEPEPRTIPALGIERLEDPLVVFWSYAWAAICDENFVPIADQRRDSHDLDNRLCGGRLQRIPEQVQQYLSNASGVRLDRERLNTNENAIAGVRLGLLEPPHGFTDQLVDRDRVHPQFGCARVG